MSARLLFCSILLLSFVLSGCANYIDERFSKDTLISNQDMVYVFRILDKESETPVDVIEVVPGFLYENGKIEQDQLRVGPPQLLTAHKGYFVFRSAKSFESKDVIILSGLRSSEVLRPVAATGAYGYCKSGKVFAINNIQNGVSYLGDVLVDLKQGGFSFDTRWDKASLIKFLETNLPNIPTHNIKNDELGFFEVDQTCSRVINIY